MFSRWHSVPTFVNKSTEVGRVSSNISCLIVPPTSLCCPSGILYNLNVQHKGSWVVGKCLWLVQTQGIRHYMDMSVTSTTRRIVVCCRDVSVIGPSEINKSCRVQTINKYNTNKQKFLVTDTTHWGCWKDVSVTGTDTKNCTL